MNAFNLEPLTGKLAVGSIIVTSVAATFQAFVDLKPIFERLTSMGVWDIFVAFPIVVLSYLAGALGVGFSSMWFNYRRKDSIDQRVSRIIRIGNAEKDVVVSRYEKLMQELELVQGACPAIAFLGIAVALNVITTVPSEFDVLLPQKSVVFGFSSVLILAFVPCLAFLSRRIYQEILELVKQADELETSPSPTDNG